MSKALPSKQNLADHKTRMDLILSSLAEETATGLHQKNDSQGYIQIEQDVKDAGDTASDARRAVELRYRLAESRNCKSRLAYPP